MDLLPRGALGAWWAQGARSLVFRQPDWTAVTVTPAVVGALWLVPVAFAAGAERLMLLGPARFYWPALLSLHWMFVVVGLLVCWALMRGRPADGPAPHEPVMLFAMLLAQMLPLQAVLTLLLVPLVRGGAFADDGLLNGITRGVWFAGTLWTFAAQGVLLARAAPRRPRAWALALGTLVLTSVLQMFYAPLRQWYPQGPEETGAADSAPRFRLTQELVEAQGQALVTELAALQPRRAGRIGFYALTYAPVADEAVFARESEMVASVMAERFDAGGGTVQLVSTHDAAPRHGWATPLNLQRAIARIAGAMDRDEDVLFIHLTSHGGKDAKLASSLWPLEVDELTPQQLKAMLDAAGIRHRVISVSACYSGSWLAPLANDDTLVMTAADADHTSYGCGRHSELTFFGRAMYDEELRRTRSFETAHAAAREVIGQREKEAGKSDGYSNPQIAMGTAIRATLARLNEQLEGR